MENLLLLLLFVLLITFWHYYYTKSNYKFSPNSVFGRKYTCDTTSTINSLFIIISFRHCTLSFHLCEKVQIISGFDESKWLPASQLRSMRSFRVFQTIKSLDIPWRLYFIYFSTTWSFFLSGREVEGRGMTTSARRTGSSVPGVGTSLRIEESRHSGNATYPLWNARGFRHHRRKAWSSCDLQTQL